MKVRAVKIALGAIIALLYLTSVIQGASFWASQDVYESFNGLAEFRMKVADVLDSNKKDKKIYPSAVPFPSTRYFSPIGMNSSSSAFYPTDIGFSGLSSSEFGLLSNNQSSENETRRIQSGRTSLTAFDYLFGGLDLSQRSSSSPSRSILYNQGAFKSIWFIEARKHEIKSSGINDRMILSGDFSVQKRVSFSG